MATYSGQRITSLPTATPPYLAEKPTNVAREVQSYVGSVMDVVMTPANFLNQGLAKLTYGFAQMLPKMPAARTLNDLVLGWPHSHAHPPTFGVPLPSIGPVICAGACSVLINGMPTARVGDVGFGAWCGGFMPLFEVFTGSSHVFIGGSRPARQLIDFTRHCLPGEPGVTTLGAAMMAFSAGMSALAVTASLTDMSNALDAADAATTAAEAAAASASATAAGVGATVAAVQMAADAAAAALVSAMGTDPGAGPCLGNFITGSPNVVIGGFPMPGWLAILGGLAKLLRKAVRRAPPKLKFAQPEPPPPFKFGPGPMSAEAAQELFNRMAAQDDIAFKYPTDGCYARAHIMAQRMQEMGATPAKAWTFASADNDPLWVSTPNNPKGYVAWGYHVAPTIKVLGEDGVVRDMVIDPSMHTGPVTVDQWKDAQHDNPTVVQTQLGEPPWLEGSGYWPGEDPVEGPDAHAAKTMEKYKAKEGTDQPTD